MLIIKKTRDNHAVQGLSLALVGSLLFGCVMPALAEGSLWETRRKALESGEKEQRKAEEPWKYVEEVESGDKDGLGLPEGLGSETEKGGGKAGLEVWHIQDAHGYVEAQRNAAKILKILRAKAGGKDQPLLVCVEGAWGRVELEWLHLFPDAGVLQRFAERMLAESRITGEEYAGILEGKDAYRIEGVEEEETFLRNIRAREAVEKAREEILDGVGEKGLSRVSVRSLLAGAGRLRLRLSNERVRDLDGEREIWERGERDTGGYAMYLRRAAPDVWEREAGEALKGFYEVTDLGLRIDSSRLSGERDQFLKELAENLDRAGLEKLAEASLKFRTGGMKAARYYGLLAKLGESHGRSLPEIGRYRDYLEKQEGLDLGAVRRELASLDDAVDEKLCGGNPALQKSGEAYRRLKLEEKLWGLEMSPEDWERYEAAKKAGRTDYREIRKLLEERKEGIGSEDEWRLFQDRAEGMRTEAEAFYLCAEKRNGLMIEGVLKKAEESGAAKVVLIAGGYHTDGMVRLLKGKGVGYRVIRPDLGSRQQVKRDEGLTEAIRYVGTLRAASAFALFIREHIAEFYVDLMEAGFGLKAGDFVEMMKEYGRRLADRGEMEALVSDVAGHVAISDVFEAKGKKYVLGSLQGKKARMNFLLESGPEGVRAIYDEATIRAVLLGGKQFKVGEGWNINPLGRDSPVDPATFGLSWSLSDGVLRFESLEPASDPRASPAAQMLRIPSSEPPARQNILRQIEIFFKNLLRPSVRTPGGVIAGGLIGKYQVVTEPRFDSVRGELTFEGRDISREGTNGEVITIVLKAREADLKEADKVLMKLQHNRLYYPDRAERLMQDIVSWFIDRKFGGKFLILEPNNKYEIQGLGTKGFIALSEDYKDQEVALFHEVSEAKYAAAGGDPREQAAGILAELDQDNKIWYRVMMKEGRRAGLDIHYAIRALQRQVLGMRDEDLTAKIRGKLDRMQALDILREEGVEKVYDVYERFAGMRTGTMNREDEAALLRRMAKEQKWAEAELQQEFWGIIVPSAADSPQADELWEIDSILEDAHNTYLAVHMTDPVGAEEDLKPADQRQAELLARELERNQKVLDLLEKLNGKDPALVAAKCVELMGRDILRDSSSVPNRFAEFMTSSGLAVLDARVLTAVLDRFSDPILSERLELKRRIEMSERLNLAVEAFVRSGRPDAGILFDKLVDLTRDPRSEKSDVAITRFEGIRDFHFYTIIEGGKIRFPADFWAVIKEVRNPEEKIRLQTIYLSHYNRQNFVPNLLRSALLQDKSGDLRRRLLDEAARADKPFQRVLILRAMNRVWGDITEALKLKRKDLEKAIEPLVRNAVSIFAVRRWEYNREDVRVVLESLAGLSRHPIGPEQKRAIFERFKKDIDDMPSQVSLDRGRLDVLDSGHRETEVLVHTVLRLDILANFVETGLSAPQGSQQAALSDEILDYLIACSRGLMKNDSFPEQSDILVAEATRVLQRFVSIGNSPAIWALMEKMTAVGEENGLAEACEPVLFEKPSSKTDGQMVALLEEWSSREPAFHERAACLLMLRHQSRPRVLRNIIKNEKIDIRYRMYALSLYSERAASGDNPSRAKDFRALASRLLDGADRYLREEERVGAGASVAGLFDEYPLQEQSAKIKMMAVALAMHKHHPLTDDRSFVRLARSIDGTVISSFYGNADSGGMDFELGKSLFKKHGFNLDLFYLVVAHEEMHDLLVNQFKYESNHIVPASIHETLADAYAFEFAGHYGVPDETREKLTDWSRHVWNVSSDEWQAVEEHEAARAQMAVIEAAFREFRSVGGIDWGRFIDKGIFVAVSNPFAYDLRQTFFRIIDDYFGKKRENRRLSREGNRFQAVLSGEILGMDVRQKILDGWEITGYLEHIFSAAFSLGTTLYGFLAAAGLSLFGYHFGGWAGAAVPALLAVWGAVKVLRALELILSGKITVSEKAGHFDPVSKSIDLQESIVGDAVVESHETAHLWADALLNQLLNPWAGKSLDGDETFKNSGLTGWLAEKSHAPGDGASVRAVLLNFIVNDVIAEALAQMLDLFAFARDILDPGALLNYYDARFPGQLKMFEQRTSALNGSGIIRSLESAFYRLFPGVPVPVYRQWIAPFLTEGLWVDFLPALAGFIAADMGLGMTLVFWATVGARAVLGGLFYFLHDKGERGPPLWIWSVNTLVSTALLFAVPHPLLRLVLTYLANAAYHSSFNKNALYAFPRDPGHLRSFAERVIRSGYAGIPEALRDDWMRKVIGRYAEILWEVRNKQGGTDALKTVGEIAQALEDAAETVRDQKGKRDSYQFVDLKFDAVSETKMIQIVTPAGVNCYLLPTGGGHYILVDSGYAVLAEDLAGALESRGIDVAEHIDEIWLTHADPDHAGGAFILADGALANGRRIPIRVHPRFKESLDGRNASVNPPSAEMQPAAAAAYGLATGFARPDLGRYDVRFLEPSGEAVSLTPDGDPDWLSLGRLKAGEDEYEVFQPLGGHTVDSVVFVSVPKSDSEPRILISGDLYENFKKLTAKERNIYLNLARAVGPEGVDLSPQNLKSLREKLGKTPKKFIVGPAAGGGFIRAEDFKENGARMGTDQVIAEPIAVSRPTDKSPPADYVPAAPAKAGDGAKVLEANRGIWRKVDPAHPMMDLYKTAEEIEAMILKDPYSVMVSKVGDEIVGVMFSARVQTDGNPENIFNQPWEDLIDVNIDKFKDGPDTRVFYSVGAVRSDKTRGLDIEKNLIKAAKAAMRQAEETRYFFTCSPTTYGREGVLSKVLGEKYQEYVAAMGKVAGGLEEKILEHLKYKVGEKWLDIIANLHLGNGAKVAFVYTGEYRPDSPIASVVYDYSEELLTVPGHMSLSRKKPNRFASSTRRFISAGMISLISGGLFYFMYSADIGMLVSIVAFIITGQLLADWDFYKFGYKHAPSLIVWPVSAIGANFVLVYLAVQGNLSAGFALNVALIFNGINYLSSKIIYFLERKGTDSEFYEKKVHAPIVEEIVYRYIFYDLLFHQSLTGLVIVSVVFALIHFVSNRRTFSSIFRFLVTGFILTAIYSYFGIYASIVAHSISNFILPVLAKKEEEHLKKKESPGQAGVWKMLGWTDWKGVFAQVPPSWRIPILETGLVLVVALLAWPLMALAPSPQFILNLSLAAILAYVLVMNELHFRTGIVLPGGKIQIYEEFIPGMIRGSGGRLKRSDFVPVDDKDLSRQNAYGASSTAALSLLIVPLLLVLLQSYDQVYPALMAILEKAYELNAASAQLTGTPLAVADLLAHVWTWGLVALGAGLSFAIAAAAHAWRNSKMKTPSLNGKRILDVSFRLNYEALDGVSMETDKWSDIANRAGAEVHYFSGESNAPDYVAGQATNPLAHFRNPEIEAMTERMFKAGEISPEDLERLNEIKEVLKRDLIQYIRENRIEYLIAENTLCYPGNLALSMALVEAANEMDVKVIAHSHDFWWERDRFNHVQPGSNLQKMLDQMILGPKRMSILVINKNQQEELKKRYGVDSEVAPNVMNFEKPPKADPERIKKFRRELGVGDDEYLILLPVRPIPRKNLEMAVDLGGEVEEILKSVPKGKSVKLMVTHPSGDEGTAYFDAIAKRAGELGIKFVDGSPRIGLGKDFSLDDAYDACDVVFYTSEIEGWGNALAEAVHRKKLVVVYPYPVYLQDIKPTGVECVEVERSSPEAAAQVLDYLQNPEKMRQAVDKNYEIFRENFAYWVIKKKLEDAVDLLDKMPSREIREKEETWKKIEGRLARIYGPEKAEGMVRKLRGDVVSEFEKNASKAVKAKLSRKQKLTPEDVSLITYADSIVDPSGRKKPLQLLIEFVKRNKIKMVHILPCYPWDTDRGFSVLDYRKIFAGYGSWKDIRNLSKTAKIMLDFVVNHASVNNPLVQSALISRHLPAEHPESGRHEPYRDYVIAFSDDGKPSAEDLSKLTRPRKAPVLSKYIVVKVKAGRREVLQAVLVAEADENGQGRKFSPEDYRNGISLVKDKDGNLRAIAGGYADLTEQEKSQTREEDVVKAQPADVEILGSGWVWTTFSRDKRGVVDDTRQVDLNFENPDVFLEMVKILLVYAENGADFIRLDAIGYMWKKLGSASLHEQETHILIQTLQEVLSTVAPGVTLIAEVNEPHDKVGQYFEQDGEKEVDMVYQFGHFPLAVHALLTGNARYYREWLDKIKDWSGKQFVTGAGSHDGMGMKPLMGILPDEERNKLIEILGQKHNALMNEGVADGQRIVYEICATAWNLVNAPGSDEPLEVQLKKYRAIMALGLMHRGIPAIYINSFFGAPNNPGKLDENRTINREQFEYGALFEKLFGDNKTGEISQERRALEQVTALVGKRGKEKAFDPDGPPVRALSVSEDRSDRQSDAVIATWMESPDGDEAVLQIVSVSPEKQTVRIDLRNEEGWPGRFVELLSGSGREYVVEDSVLTLDLEPYDTLWLKASRKSADAGPAAETDAETENEEDQVRPNASISAAVGRIVQYLSGVFASVMVLPRQMLENIAASGGSQDVWSRALSDGPSGSLEEWAVKIIGIVASVLLLGLLARVWRSRSAKKRAGASKTPEKVGYPDPLETWLESRGTDRVRADVVKETFTGGETKIRIDHAREVNHKDVAVAWDYAGTGDFDSLLWTLGALKQKQSKAKSIKLGITLPKGAAGQLDDGNVDEAVRNATVLMLDSLLAFTPDIEIISEDGISVPVELWLKNNGMGSAERIKIPDPYSQAKSPSPKKKPLSLIVSTDAGEKSLAHSLSLKTGKPVVALECEKKDGVWRMQPFSEDDLKLLWGRTVWLVNDEDAESTDGVLKNLLVTAALKRAGANVQLISPYFRYGRQDGQEKEENVQKGKLSYKPGEAISAEIRLRLLGRLTADMHFINLHLAKGVNEDQAYRSTNHLPDGLPPVAFKNINAMPVLGRHIFEKLKAERRIRVKGGLDFLRDAIFLAPDQGVENFVETASDATGAKRGSLNKERKDGKVRILSFYKEVAVAGKVVVILDDLTTTGSTLTGAATHVLWADLRKKVRDSLESGSAKGLADRVDGLILRMGFMLYKFLHFMNADPYDFASLGLPYLFVAGTIHGAYSKGLTQFEGSLIDKEDVYMTETLSRTAPEDLRPENIASLTDLIAGHMSGPQARTRRKAESGPPPLHLDAKYVGGADMRARSILNPKDLDAPFVGNAAFLSVIFTSVPFIALAALGYERGLLLWHVLASGTAFILVLIWYRAAMIRQHIQSLSGAPYDPERLIAPLRSEILFPSSPPGSPWFQMGDDGVLTVNKASLQSLPPYFQRILFLAVQKYLDSRDEGLARARIWADLLTPAVGVSVVIGVTEALLAGQWFLLSLLFFLSVSYPFMLKYQSFQNRIYKSYAELAETVESMAGDPEERDAIPIVISDWGLKTGHRVDAFMNRLTEVPATEGGKASKLSRLSYWQSLSGAGVDLDPRDRRKSIYQHWKDNKLNRKNFLMNPMTLEDADELDKRIESKQLVILSELNRYRWFELLKWVIVDKKKEYADLEAQRIILENERNIQINRLNGYIGTSRGMNRSATVSDLEILDQEIADISERQYYCSPSARVEMVYKEFRRVFRPAIEDVIDWPQGVLRISLARMGLIEGRAFEFGKDSKGEHITVKLTETVLNDPTGELTGHVQAMRDKNPNATYLLFEHVSNTASSIVTMVEYLKKQGVAENQIVLAIKYMDMKSTAYLFHLYPKLRIYVGTPAKGIYDKKEDVVSEVEGSDVFQKDIKPNPGELINVGNDRYLITRILGYVRMRAVRWDSARNRPTDEKVVLQVATGKTEQNANKWLQDSIEIIGDFFPALAGWLRGFFVLPIDESQGRTAYDGRNGIMVCENRPDLVTPNEYIIGAPNALLRFGRMLKLVLHLGIILCVTTFFVDAAYKIPEDGLMYDKQRRCLVLMSQSGVNQSEPVFGEIYSEAGATLKSWFKDARRGARREKKKGTFIKYASKASALHPYDAPLRTDRLHLAGEGDYRLLPPESTEEKILFEEILDKMVFIEDDETSQRALIANLEEAVSQNYLAAIGSMRRMLVRAEMDRWSPALNMINGKLEEIKKKHGEEAYKSIVDKIRDMEQALPFAEYRSYVLNVYQGLYTSLEMIDTALDLRQSPLLSEKERRNIDAEVIIGVGLYRDLTVTTSQTRDDHEKGGALMAWQVMTRVNEAGGQVNYSRATIDKVYNACLRHGWRQHWGRRTPTEKIISDANNLTAVNPKRIIRIEDGRPLYNPKFLRTYRILSLQELESLDGLNRFAHETPYADKLQFLLAMLFLKTKYDVYHTVPGKAAIDKKNFDDLKKEVLSEIENYYKRLSSGPSPEMSPEEAEDLIRSIKILVNELDVLLRGNRAAQRGIIKRWRPRGVDARRFDDKRFVLSVMRRTIRNTATFIRDVLPAWDPHRRSVRQGRLTRAVLKVLDRLEGIDPKTKLDYQMQRAVQIRDHYLQNPDANMDDYMKRVMAGDGDVYVDQTTRFNLAVFLTEAMYPVYVKELRDYLILAGVAEPMSEKEIDYLAMMMSNYFLYCALKEGAGDPLKQAFQGLNPNTLDFLHDQFYSGEAGVRYLEDHKDLAAMDVGDVEKSLAVAGAGAILLSAAGFASLGAAFLPYLALLIPLFAAARAAQSLGREDAGEFQENGWSRFIASWFPGREVRFQSTEDMGNLAAGYDREEKIVIFNQGWTRSFKNPLLNFSWSILRAFVLPLALTHEGARVWLANAAPFWVRDMPEPLQTILIYALLPLRALYAYVKAGLRAVNSEALKSSLQAVSPASVQNKILSRSRIADIIRAASSFHLASLWTRKSRASQEPVVKLLEAENIPYAAPGWGLLLLALLPLVHGLFPGLLASGGTAATPALMGALSIYGSSSILGIVSTVHLLDFSRRRRMAAGSNPAAWKFMDLEYFFLRLRYLSRDVFRGRAGEGSVRRPKAAARQAPLSDFLQALHAGSDASRPQVLVFDLRSSLRFMGGGRFFISDFYINIMKLQIALKTAGGRRPDVAFVFDFRDADQDAGQRQRALDYLQAKLGIGDVPSDLRFDWTEVPEVTRETARSVAMKLTEVYLGQNPQIQFVGQADASGGSIWEGLLEGAGVLALRAAAGKILSMNLKSPEAQALKERLPEWMRAAWDEDGGLDVSAPVLGLDQMLNEGQIIDTQA